MITKYIITCLFAGFVGIVSAQYQNFELQNPETDSKTYVGRDYVRLLPGYKCSATDGQNLHAKISSGLTTEEADNLIAPFVPDTSIFDPNIFQGLPTYPWYNKPTKTYDDITSINKNLAVGEIPISSIVSPSGAKCYNVPIEVVSGRMGFQPNISLTYNSQAGNGLLGIGWNLSGLSVIERENKNIYYDGKNETPKLSNDDAFTLDGVRLIEISRNSTQINYETAIGNTQVIGYLSQSLIGNPTFIIYFKVLFPNGNVGVFGKENNRDFAKVTFPISKLTDCIGNKINFSYIYDGLGFNETSVYLPSPSNQAYYIDEINYGSNDTSSDFAKIKFSYEDRPDQIFSLVSSKSYIYRKRLCKIVCFANTNVLRTYNLSYTNNDPRNDTNQNDISRLIQIECSINENIKLNPVKFIYGQTDHLKINSQKTSFGNNTYYYLSNINVIRGKFDTNNQNDALIVYPKGEIYLNEDGIYKHNYPANNKIKIYTNLNQSTASVDETISAEADFEELLAANIDGTGSDEIVKISSNYTNGQIESYDHITFKIYSIENNIISLSNSKVYSCGQSSGYYFQYDGGFCLTPRKYYTGNFTGLGKTEILAIPDIKQNANYSNFTYNNNQFIFDLSKSDLNPVYNGIPFIKAESDIIYPLDIDGDSQTEILHITATNTKIYKYKQGNGIINVGTWSLNKADFENRQILFSDLNEDGKADIIMSPKAPLAWSYEYPANSFNVGTTVKCPNCGQLRAASTDGMLQTVQCSKCNHSFDGYPFFMIEDWRYNPRFVKVSKCVLCNQTTDIYFKCPIHGTTNSSIYKYNHTQLDTYDSKWKYLYSKGLNSPLIVEHDLFKREFNHQYTLLDIDSDNSPELIVNMNGGIKVYPYRNDIHGFESTSIADFNITSTSELLSFDVTSQTVNVDINSDKKFTQIIALKGEGIDRISFSQNRAKNNQISLMINSIGKIEKNSYEQLYQSSNYLPGNQSVFPDVDFQGPIWVTTQTSNIFNKQIINNESYSYTGAVLHKQGLGFRGFSSMKSTNLLSNKERFSEFDPYKQGAVTKYSSDTEEINIEYNYSVATNKKTTLLPLKKTVTDKLKGNTVTVTYPLADYDSYGNAKKEITNFGSGITSTVSNTYENRLGDVNLIGLLKKKEVTNERDGKASVTGENFDYNGYGQLYFRENYIVKPNVNLISETNYIFDPSYHTLTSETTHSYLTDDYLTTSYTYWDDDKCSLHTITDPLSREATYTYDFTKRLLTETKDVYGKITSYGYDDWRRLNKITRPDGTVTDITVNWNSVDDPRYLIKETTVSTGQPTTYKLVDAFGRVTRSSVAGFAEGTEVLSDNEYDSFGRMHISSAPYKANEVPLVNTYSYDKFDRIEKVKGFNGSVTSYGYSGNTVTTNNDGVVNSKTTEATGMLASSTDAGGTVTYTYRADGQPDKINAAGVETSFEYNDPYNRQTKLIDPSAGTIETQYDDTNRKVKQIWNSGKEITTEFNTKGQVLAKYTPDFKATYSYEKGKYKDVTYTDNSRAMSKSNTYDEYGRLWKVNELVDDKTLEQEYLYDLGKLNSVTYRANTGSNLLTYPVVYKYNTNGYLYRLEDENENLLREINSVNAFGQETSVGFGNWLTTQSTYTPFGMLTNLKTSIIGTSNVIQNMGYDFNPINGTLNSRTDIKNNNLSESFNYGALYRLEGYGTTANRHSVGYNANGNIETKTDAGGYAYNLNGKPYTLSGINTTDNSGQKTQLDVNYTVMSRPTTISNGMYTAYIDYNDAYERVFEEFKQGTNVLSTKHLLAGGQYEVEAKAGVETQRLYVDGSPYSASVIVEKVGSAAAQPFYLHRDYLGSITQVSDKFGNLAAEYSYDAWGRMRNATNWQLYAAGAEPELRFGRGYTGHEHLNKFGLINMNARLYDPVLGRFLAPDPHVTAPDFTQDYNRYSYGRNNPMMYTDKNGENPFYWLGMLISSGISYLASVRDKDYKDWTPRINAIGVGYSGTNGAYAGVSFDGGAHMNNFGYNNGFTLGSSAYGNTTMGRVSNVNDPYLYVIQREQEMRSEYFTNKGMEHDNISGSILDYSSLIFAGATNVLDKSHKYLESLQNVSGRYSLGLNYSNGIDKLGKLTALTKFGGVFLSTGSLSFSTYKFLNTKEFNKESEYFMDMFVGGVGFAPGVGTGISFYWTFGGKNLHWEWTNKVLQPQLELGVPAYTIFPTK